MSNRISSKLRNKKERKKRESKRDVKKAAKAMKKAGLKPRSHRKRDVTRQALALSNANPDKARILEHLLQVRAAPKVPKVVTQEDVEDDARDGEEKRSRSRRFMVFAPPTPPQAKSKGSSSSTATSDSSVSCEQLAVALKELHGVCDVFALYLDVRCAPQCVLHRHLQMIIADSEERQQKGTLICPRRVVCILTRADTVPSEVSASAAVQVARALQSLVAEAAAASAPRKSAAAGKRGRDTTVAATSTAVVFHCVVTSAESDDSVQHSVRVLRRISDQVRAERAANPKSVSLLPAVTTDLRTKAVFCTIGLSKAGRSAHADAMLRVCGDSNIALVHPGNVQRVEAIAESAEETVAPAKLVIEGSRSLTVLELAHETAPQPAVCGDVVFGPLSAVDRLEDPETLAVLIVEQALDKTALAQAFSLPAARSATEFLVMLGRCILRDKGFRPASLLVETAGELDISGISASAACGRQWLSQRLKRVPIRKPDGRNALRVGSRVFLREFVTSDTLRWTAVERHATADLSALSVFSSVPMKPSLEASPGPPMSLTAAQFEDDVIRAGLRSLSCLLPGGALEFAPDTVAV